MRAIISFFISLLFSFFIVFFTNITSTLAFRELAVAHGVSITFVLVFIAIVTISFAVILLLYSLSRLVIDSSTNEIITRIKSNNKSIKDALEQSIIQKYTNLFNKISNIVMYDKNIISLLEILSKQIDVIHKYTDVTKPLIDSIEHKANKLLALSDSPANQLPVLDTIILPRPVVMKIAFPIIDKTLNLNVDEEVTVTAIRLDADYDSGVACETDKGLLDMGLLVK